MQNGFTLCAVMETGESIMRSSASIALALTLTLTVGPAFAGGSSLAGKWVGEMRQIDVTEETRYPMTLTLQGAKGATTYQTLKCTGTWSRIGEKDGYTVYKETARNEADGICTDGIMTVTLDAGKLVVGWFGVFEGAPSVATAVLQREAK